MRLSLFVAIFIYLILIALWLGLYLSWNYSFWWFDDALHFSGGFWVGSFFLYFIKQWRLTTIFDNYWLKLLLGLGFVALIGVLWEFHEFLADLYLQKPIFQFGVQDTISDLFLDLLGGFTFLSLWQIFKNRASYR